MRRKFNVIIVMMLLCGTGARAEYRDHRNRHVDSLEAVLNSNRHLSDRERMDAYLNLMNGLQIIDGERATHYARQALALSYKMNALNARESALYHLGLHAYGRSDWSTAEDFFRQALAVSDSMHGDHRYTDADIDDNLSQIYGALGNLYNMQDHALLAIEYYQRALPIFERHGWLQSQCILHHNVAELYNSMSNDAKAEEHYLKAIEAGEASGDSLMMALPRKGLCKIYISQGDYERARETTTAAYDYYRAHRDEEPDGYCETLASMTRLCLMEGHRDLPQARRYADEAVAGVEAKPMMSETTCDIYAVACQFAMAEGRWQEALGYGLKSVHTDEELTIGDAGGFHMLAKIYAELGDKKKSMEATDKMRTLLERFATENYQQGLSQMEVIYETEKKQAAIEQLSREKRLYGWAGLLTAVVLLLIAVLFFVLWRSVRLGRRNATMQARLDGEVSERVRLARDLHDRLGGRLTALRQQLENDSEAQRLADVAIREMRNVSHHLLPDSLERYGLRTALRDFCATMPRVRFSFIGDESHVEHEVAIYCSVHELVNNAVKSADAQHIRVQLIAADTYTAVNVSDDGHGGATFDDSNGSGLRNLRERIEAIGGRIDLYSKPGEGTEVNIEIPK